MNGEEDVSEVLWGLKCPGLDVSLGAEHTFRMKNECVAGVKWKGGNAGISSLECDEREAGSTEMCWVNWD